MSHVEFYWPYAGLLLLVILPWYFFGRKQQSTPYLQSYLTEVVEQIQPSSMVSTSNKKMLRLNFLAWTLLVCALMRPALVGDPIDVERSGRSLMLTLDISESMEARDLHINGEPLDRLSVAKSVLLDFIDHRRGDRLGLVVFGAEAFLHAPLSFDRAMIKRFLLDTQIGFAGPKTAIGNAIGLSVKKLLEEKEGDRVMILLTDGQNNSGQLEPLKAAEMAKKYRIKIYIVGLGASRIMVDGFFGPSAINPSQDLDAAEPELKQIASMTGGRYFRAKDSNALLKIYDDIDAMEPVKIDNLVAIPRKELFYWPLVLLLILGGTSIAYRRLKRGYS